MFYFQLRIILFLAYFIVFLYNMSLQDDTVEKFQENTCKLLLLDVKLYLISVSKGRIVSNI